MDKPTIINFEDYKRGKKRMEKTETRLFDELVQELEEKHGHEYTPEEIDNIANRILESYGLKGKNCSIPIVRIIQEFDFKVYKKELEDNKSGDISINGNTEEVYGHNKVVLVNKKDILEHQRFVLAHELGHYLFDFLGSPEYSNSGITFSDTYKKNQHESIQERRVNRFAAALLMPEDVFIRQYHFARSVSGNHILIVRYLSKFFETTIDSIEKRITEVLR